MSNAAQAAIAAAVAQAAKQTNVNEATKGGGGYEQPEMGLTVITLLGYIEVGIQPHEFTDPKKGKVVEDKDTALFIFELNGGKNKAKIVEKEDGEKITVAKRMTVRLPISRNEKAHYYKLFKALNYSGEYTHPAQCVGLHYVVKVEGGKSEKTGNEWRSLKGPSGYAIQPPIVMNAEGDEVAVPKPAIIGEPKVFLWDFAGKEMWDSLYIDGEYPARKDEKTGKEYPAKSKNVLQNQIKEAKNFMGSPIQKLLGDEALDLSNSPVSESGDELLAGSEPAAETGDDPLADLMG